MNLTDSQPLFNVILIIMCILIAAYFLNVDSSELFAASSVNSDGINASESGNNQIPFPGNADGIRQQTAYEQPADSPSCTCTQEGHDYTHDDSHIMSMYVALAERQERFNAALEAERNAWRDAALYIESLNKSGAGTYSAIQSTSHVDTRLYTMCRDPFRGVYPCYVDQ